MKRYKLLPVLLLALAMVTALSACGGEKDGDSASSLAGSYGVVSIISDGQEFARADLEAMGMADGTYLRLNADGTGEIGLTGEEPEYITYNEAAGTMTMDSDNETVPFTVKDGVITVNAEYAGMIFVFAPEAGGGSAPAAGISAANGQVADSIVSVLEAYQPYLYFTDSTPSGDMGMGQGEYIDHEYPEAGGAATLTGDEWCGWITVNRGSGDYADYTNYLQAIDASIGYSDSGMKYLEIFISGETENPLLSMWIEDEPTDSIVSPIIGYQDAWILNTYLTETDEDVLYSYVTNRNRLNLYYAIDDGYSTAIVQIYLWPWSELQGEELPADYDDFFNQL